MPAGDTCFVSTRIPKVHQNTFFILTPRMFNLYRPELTRASCKEEGWKEEFYGLDWSQTNGRDKVKNWKQILSREGIWIGLPYVSD